MLGSHQKDLSNLGRCVLGPLKKQNLLKDFRLAGMRRANSSKPLDLTFTIGPSWRMLGSWFLSCKRSHRIS